MEIARARWLLSGGALLLAGFAAGAYWRGNRQSGPAIAFAQGVSRSTSSASQSADRAATLDVARTGRPPPSREITPAALLQQLVSLKVSATNPSSTRALLLALERLREAGPAALPAIRDFLATGQDADFDAVSGRPFRNGSVPLEFVVPPSLRLGLLEVVKNIGGADAETLLLQELKTTGRGVEAAYLGGVLQQISTEKYREPALAAARELLAMPLTTRAGSVLDRSDREYLYGVLATAADPSHVDQAKAQLLLPNGQIDQGALRYLRQMLGDQVVGVAAQAWQDPRLDGQQREPLARVALAYVGANAEAEKLYRQAIEDPALSPGARKNLIEDLNEAGFADPKHLTAADLPLIEKRLALIEQLAPRAKDRTNAAAFVEARKDLLDMRDSLLAAKPPR